VTKRLKGVAASLLYWIIPVLSKIEHLSLLLLKKFRFPFEPCMFLI